MLRVPEHYAHFGAHGFGQGWDGDAERIAGAAASEASTLQGLLHKTRKVVLWGVFAVPALLVMAVWQIVDPADSRYEQEQPRD